MFKHKSGIQLALMTAGISGISIFVNKLAVGFIKPPVLYTGLKNVMAGMLILAALVALKKLPQLVRLKSRHWLTLLTVGIIGGYVPFYLFFTGLAGADVVAGAIIQKTLIFWVALMAMTFLKEKLSVLTLAGVLVLFYANAAVGGFKGFAYSVSELYILAATLLWSVETIIVKKALSDFDPMILAFGRMGIGSALLLLTAHFTSPAGLGAVASLTVTQWSLTALTALSLFAYVTSWYGALAKAEAITVMALLVPATLITNLLSAAFLTHTLSYPAIIQMALMVLGVGLFLYGRKYAGYNDAKNRLVQKAN